MAPRAARISQHGLVPDYPAAGGADGVVATDWGIPNWRDPSAYGDTLSMVRESLDVGEFTRRREDFRSDFPDQRKKRASVSAQKAQGVSEPNKRRWTADEPGFVAATPPGAFKKYRLPSMPNASIK